MAGLPQARKSGNAQSEQPENTALRCVVYQLYPADAPQTATVITCGITARRKIAAIIFAFNGEESALRQPRFPISSNRRRGKRLQNRYSKGRPNLVV